MPHRVAARGAVNRLLLRAGIDRRYAVDPGLGKRSIHPRPPQARERPPRHGKLPVGHDVRVTDEHNAAHMAAVPSRLPKQPNLLPSTAAPLPSRCNPIDGQRPCIVAGYCPRNGSHHAKQCTSHVPSMSGSTSRRNSAVPHASSRLPDSGIRLQSRVVLTPRRSSIGRAPMTSQLISPRPM